MAPGDNHLVETLKSVLVPVHREGYPFIAMFGAAALVLGLVWSPLGWLGLILTLWCAYFFRDPPRVTPQREGLIISPADGVVQKIETVIPPAELEMGAQTVTRISVFMNVFNVHINRAPVSGKVRALRYHPGRFLNASLDKASEENERQMASITMDDGKVVGMVQIAGLVARRILCWLREGGEVKTGERFGLIRFGSRVDVYLPAGVAPLVCEGQTSVAGETVLADLRGSESARAGVKG